MPVTGQACSFLRGAEATFSARARAHNLRKFYSYAIDIIRGFSPLCRRKPTDYFLLRVQDTRVSWHLRQTCSAKVSSLLITLGEDFLQCYLLSLRTSAPLRSLCVRLFSRGGAFPSWMEWAHAEGFSKYELRVMAYELSMSDG